MRNTETERAGHWTGELTSRIITYKKRSFSQFAPLRVWRMPSQSGYKCQAFWGCRLQTRHSKERCFQIWTGSVWPCSSTATTRVGFYLWVSLFRILSTQENDLYSQHHGSLFSAPSTPFSPSHFWFPKPHITSLPPFPHPQSPWLHSSPLSLWLPKWDLCACLFTVLPELFVMEPNIPSQPTHGKLPTTSPPPHDGPRGTSWQWDLFSPRRPGRDWEEEEELYTCRRPKGAQSMLPHFSMALCMKS